MRIFPPFFFFKSQPRAPFDIVTDETHIQNSMYTYFKTKKKNLFFLSFRFSSLHIYHVAGIQIRTKKKKSQFTTASIYNIKFTHPFVSRGDLLLGKLRDLLWKTGGNKKTRSAPIESHTYWKVHFIFKW